MTAPGLKHKAIQWFVCSIMSILLVGPSSSYFEHLVEINARLKKEGLAYIKIIHADEWLESEDLLEMVNTGLVKATVVDHYLAKVWQPLFNLDNFFPKSRARNLMRTCKFNASDQPTRHK